MATGPSSITFSRLHEENTTKEHNGDDDWKEKLNDRFRKNVCSFEMIKFIMSILKTAFVVWQPCTIMYMKLWLVHKGAVGSLVNNVCLLLVLFGMDRKEFANFLDKNNIAIKNLMLKNWKPEFETMPYPPSTGEYALYTIDELHAHIDFAINQVYSLPRISVGSFFLKDDIDAVQICFTYLQMAQYNQTSRHIILDTTTEKECSYVSKTFERNYGLNNTLTDLMESYNGTAVRLMSARVLFTVESIYVRKVGVQCFNIDVEILFDNGKINGQIPVTLHTNIKEFKCRRTSTQKASDMNAEFTFYAVVILSSITLVWSFICFCQSISLGCKRPNTQKLSCLSWWQILKKEDFITVLFDIITIFGTAEKYILDNKDDLMSLERERLYNVSAITLGLGCLFNFLQILHHLNFCSQFYLLFAVIEFSTIKIVLFSSCIAGIFMGFALMGWLVLGPYHLKFASIETTCQTLFSLLNGDEVFVTFTAIERGPETARVFSKIFITVFVFVFSIIALNIFIAIFNTTYEGIQRTILLDEKGGSFSDEQAMEINMKISEIQKLLGRYKLSFAEMKNKCHDKDTERTQNATNIKTAHNQTNVAAEDTTV